LIHVHYICRQLLKERYASRDYSCRYSDETAEQYINEYLNHPKFPREQIPEKWKLAF